MHTKYKAEKVRKAAAQAAAQAKQNNKSNKKNKVKGKKPEPESTSEDTEATTTETETETEAETETEPESEEVSEEPPKRGQGGKNKKQQKQQKNAKNNDQNSEAAPQSRKKGGKKGGAKATASEEPPSPPEKAPDVPVEAAQKPKKSKSKSKDRVAGKKKSDIAPQYPPPELRRPNLIMPIQSKVSHVEHVVESDADPSPNAFHDSRNGILRHYTGPVYGNPHGQLYPQRSYSNNPPIGTPHPLNNPWYNGFRPDQTNSQAPPQVPGPQQQQWHQQKQWLQQGPGPQQPQYPRQGPGSQQPQQYYQQGPMPMPPQQSTRQPVQQPPMNGPPPNNANGPAPWFQGWGSTVVGRGDKAGGASPQISSPSVGVVNRKHKKNVAFSARDASTGYGEPTTGSGRSERSERRHGKKSGYARDSNTLWAGSDTKSPEDNGRKSTESRHKSGGSNSSRVNFGGETVDSFLSRLNSNSSRHDSPQGQAASGGGSFRNAPAQNDAGYGGWNGQDNGFPTGGASAAPFAGSNNGGWGGNNQWEGSQNGNINNNNSAGGFGGGSQGWNNNTSPVQVSNNDGNNDMNQGFNTGFDGQQNSMGASNNLQKDAPWGGSNRGGSKKNEGSIQFGGNTSNQFNGAPISPMQGSQQNWGNNSNNNANQPWGDENTSNNGGGFPQQGWGNSNGSNNGGGNTNWGTASINGNANAMNTSGQAASLGGDANNDSRWTSTPANDENNVFNISNQSSHKSHNGSRNDNNVGPSSHHSGDIPGVSSFWKFCPYH